MPDRGRRSTTPPIATASVATALVLLMSCCSIGVCICGKEDPETSPQHAPLHAPLSVNAPLMAGQVSGAVVAGTKVGTQ